MNLTEAETKEIEKLANQWHELRGGNGLKVADRLPEVNQRCLVFVWDQHILFAMYKGRWPESGPGKGSHAWLADDLDNYASEDVTHWMPLPEPPTKD